MAVFYFDKATGKRVKKATWKRSKARGGTRYVRRTLKAKRKPVKARRDFHVTLMGGRGRKPKGYHRMDFIVPLESGSKRDIRQAMLKYLPEKFHGVVRKAFNIGQVEIAEGPKTKRKKPQWR